MMMNNRLTPLLLAAASLVVAPVAQAAHRKAAGAKRPQVVRGNQPVSYGAPVASVSRPVSEVVLAIGRGQLVTLPGAMKDVFIADDKIADVQVKANNQLYVFGKGSGETTIYASNGSGQVIWSATVRVGSNIESVDQMLKVAMPDSKIAVSTLASNTLLLTGTVRAPEDAAEAQRLVLALLGKDANVITRLKTATPLQVNLQVRIAEVSRSLSKSIGVNLTSADSTGGFKFGIGQGRSFYPIYTPGAPLGIGTSTTTGTSTVSALTGSTTIAMAGKVLGLDLLGALDAGETAGLVTTLAQPNLTALSGETGEFLAGGEFPIPMSSGLGTVNVEFKKYGVSLSYTPTVLSDGRISLRVRPEVSELSSQGAVTLNGYSIPGLTIRRAETSVELGSGQSLMIGGLLSNNSSNTIQKLPGAGDIPMLGTLFKSTSFQKGESELVIVITPYLVRPVNDGDIKLPTDGLQTADDAQRLIGQMMTDGKSGAARPGPVAAPVTAPQPEATKPDAENAPTKVGEAPVAGQRAVAAQTQPPGFSLN
jgi:pilus assembly protein CpaC